MLMDILELTQISNALFPLHIGNLTTYHSRWPSIRCHILNNCKHIRCRSPQASSLCNTVKCVCKQAVSCQNGHSLAEHFMIRQFTATVIIVIHSRQIIMNQ
ncbi:hypothetical protein D3C80_1442420 [compost metagenome]